MAKLLILGGAAHGGTCWLEFALAARRLGHEVVTVAPRFTRADAARWCRGLRTDERDWVTPVQARLYAEEVYAAGALTGLPDVVCTPGQPLDWPLLPTPDALLVFCQHGETPTIAWTSAQRARFPRRAALYGDTHTGQLAWQVQAARDYTHVFVLFQPAAVAAFRAAGCRHVQWLPAAANPQTWVHAPELAQRYEVVVCAAMNSAVHRWRVGLVRALQLAGIAVHVERAYGPRAALLYNQAKLVLNRSLAGDLNLRVPEAMATGALLVTDAVDGLTSVGYGGGDELPCVLYDGDKVERTVGRIQELLDEPEQNRRSRGLAGRALVLTRHTWEHRVQQLLDAVLEEKEASRPAPREEQGDSLCHVAEPTQELARGAAEDAAQSSVVSAVGRPGPEVSAVGRPGPEVSIIIPAYNHWQDCTRPLLDRLLNGLQAAPVSSLECLVVDDGSSDATAGLDARGLARIVHHPTNRGFAAACNTGALAARGRALVFLNNDTQPESGWLGPLIEELSTQDCIVGPLLRFPVDAAHRRAGQVQSAGLWQDADGRWWNQETVPDAVRTEQLAVTGACLAIWRSTFWRLGGFPEDYGKRVGCEDVHLCLTARVQGLPVVLRQDSVVVHAEGTTRFADLDDPQERDEFRNELVAAQTLLRDRFGLIVAAAARAARREQAQHTGDGDTVGMAVAASGDRAVEHADPAAVLLAADGGGVGRVGRTAAAARPVVTVAWEGARDPQVGGSLAIINRALDEHLLGGDGSSGLFVFAINDGGAVSTARGAVRAAVDVWVSHLWPSTAPHPVPTLPAAQWLIIQPWECGAYPPAWDQTFRDDRFRLLLTPSEHSRRLFLAGGVLRPDQVRVVPNGVDTRRFCPQGARFSTRESTAQHFRVLFVGGPIWRKGLDLLYAAWQQAFVPGEPVRLVVKAQGAESFYRGQAIPPPPDGHGGTIQVLTRHFDEEELARLYRTVDVLCQPSRAEGFGLPVLEAMATGTPVLVPDQGAMAEFVPADWPLVVRGEWAAYQGQGDHGPIVWPLGEGITPSPGRGTAAFVYQTQVEELARALRWCFLNRPQLRALGARLRPVAERYDWTQVAAQYAAVLTEVAAAA